MLGLGATVVGFALERPSPRVLGGNSPINPGAASRLDLTTNNSPTVVRNPASPMNVAEANRIDTPRFSCALHTSFDGGASWAPTSIPFPEGEEAPPRCFAPDIAFGADGTLYLTFATLRGSGNVPNAIWLTRSTDGGRTLSTPERRLGPLAFQVRLVADAERAGRLYLTWLQAAETVSFGLPNAGNPILMARSDDGGATWTAPLRVSSPSRQKVVAPSVAVGPRGLLYAVYLDLRDNRLDYHGAHQGQGGPPDSGPWELVLARSADGGASWRETTVDRDLIPIERFIVFIPPSPSVAVDRRDGRIYIGFHDGSAGDADVMVWTSGNGGASVSERRRVNDTPRRDGTWQYLPALAVAPNGRLDVLYYDRRLDPKNTFNEVSMQSSTDGGRTFTRRLRLSDRAFDSRMGFGVSRDLPDLGTRLALVTTSRRALAVWPDTRSGTEDTIKQDLATAVVDFPPAPRAQGLLRTGGPLLALVALAVLVWFTRTGSRRVHAAEPDSLHYRT